MKTIRKSWKIKAVLCINRKLGRYAPRKLKELVLRIEVADWLNKGKLIRGMYRDIRRGVESGELMWPTAF